MLSKSKIKQIRSLELKKFRNELNAFRFGTEYVGGVLATNNMFDAEPVGQSYDRTEIAGVLYPVEGKD